MDVVFVIARPTRSCFGCQKLIKKKNLAKIGMWSPSNWVSNIDHIGCGLAIATPTRSCFVIKKLIKGPAILN